MDNCNLKYRMQIVYNVELLYNVGGFQIIMGLGSLWYMYTSLAK